MNAKIQARDVILAALRDEMTHRNEHRDLKWIRNERLAVMAAANEWITETGRSTWLSESDVEACENEATGHSDYATKFALYVAERACGDIR